MTIQAIRQDRARDARDTAPIRNCVAFAIPAQKAVVSRVVVLFDGRRPVAILGCIVPIIVAALECVTRCWAWTHIRVKSRKLQPAITHLNAAATIVAICPGRWVKTTPQHTRPHAIFRAIGFSVNRQPRCSNLITSTAARLRVTATQMISQYDRFFSAIAAASPLDAAPAVNGIASSIGDDCKLMKMASDQIFAWRHATILSSIGG